MEKLTGNAKYNSRLTELNGFYDPWKNVFQDISDYLLPGRGLYLTGMKDPNVQDILGRFKNILDATGTRANATLGAMMQGGLADSTTHWFAVTLMDEDLSEYAPVKRWLAEVERVLYKVYEGSNFYSTIQSALEEEGGFGTASVLTEEHKDNLVNYRLSSCGEYRVANGADGRVDTQYRDIRMTAREIVEKFGKDACSDQVIKAYERTPFEYFPVIHVVTPNEKYQEGSPYPKEFEYKNLWYEPDEESKMLLDSGYNEKPFAVPRWSVAGTIPYGFSPGILTIGKIKMLQEFEKGSIKGLHKTNDPPMAVSSKYKGVLSLLPGALNTIDMDDMGRAVNPLYQVNIRWQDLEYKVDKIQNYIEKAFYNDLFLLISGASKTMTATEVLEKQEEKLLLLGPVVRRQLNELFDPTMNRTFNILQRRDIMLKKLGFGGLWSNPPAEIVDNNAQLKIKYESVLAQAQQLIAARSINNQMTMVERVAGVDPKSAIASTDFVKLLASHASAINVPVDITRSPEDAEAILQAINQAEQEAQQAAQAQQMAGAAKDLGQTDMSGDSALNRLAEGVQQ